MAHEYLVHMQFEVDLGAGLGGGPGVGGGGGGSGNVAIPVVPSAPVQRGLDVLDKVVSHMPGSMDAHLLVARTRCALRQVSPALG